MELIFFNNWESLSRVVITSLFAYPAVLIILRISGKRTLSKMNLFDFIVTVALGSILATVILNNNIPVVEGLAAFVMLILFQFVITYFSARSKAVSKLVKSSPRMLAYDGNLIHQNMLDERIDEDEIWEALRQKGFSSLDEVGAVVLETNGNMTVIEQIKDQEAPTVKEFFEGK